MRCRESIRVGRRIQKVDTHEKTGERMFEIDSMTGIIALVSVLLAFLTPILIIVAVLVHKSRRTARIHQTMIALAEKGVPIPPDLFVDRKVSSQSSLSKGVVLIAVGLGLIVFFLSFTDRHAPWGIGAIPLLIGVGYLIVWWLEERKKP
jgi:hypothetical protein